MSFEKYKFDTKELFLFLLAPLIIAIFVVAAWVLSRIDVTFRVFSSFEVNSTVIAYTIALMAVIFGGWQRFYTGIKDILNRKITVNVFITVAISVTIVTGEILPASVIILIMAIVGSLEAYTLERTRKSISKLLELTPKTANVIQNQAENKVNLSEIKIGDIVVVRPGERIPVDGIVIDGEATVNQAPITGESMPVEKIKGSEVFAGTLNETGRLEIKTTKVGPDTTLAKIVHLVEEAQESKAPIQSVADRFTTWFLPTVLLIAIIAFFLSGNIKVAVAVLLVACPCAFAIATPSAVSAGIANMARRAVLIKGGIYFEVAGKIDTLVIDKTGTITLGRPKVVEIIGEEVEEELIRISAVAEKYSEHPLAKAILNFAKEKNVTIPDPESFKILTGMGVEAKINGFKILVGRENYLIKNGIEISSHIRDIAEKQINLGRTVIYVAKGEKALGIIAIEDEIKSETISAISSLKKIGLKDIVMLTGDNKNTAREVSKKIALDAFYAELLPEDKQNVVKELKKEGRVIGMVGDGINDAPALALADVGIVMGKMGTDIAIEASDVTLMDDNLFRIVEFIKMSRKVLKRIKLNIFFSIIYNIIGLTLAATGYLTPVLAVIFQEAGCITVALSSTQLLFSKVK